MKPVGLSYILNLLKVSPTDLSKHIHVDRSLISKWKCGQRKIDITSLYFEETISYLIKKNEDIGLCTLERLFHDIYEEELTNREEVRYYIRRFIIEEESHVKIYKKQESATNEFIVPAIIYNGLKESQKSFLVFLDYALSLPAKKKLTLIHSTMFDLFLYDESLRNECIEKMKQLLDLGWEIDIISTHSYKYQLVLHFATLLLHPNCNFLSYIYPGDRNGNFSIYMIDDVRVAYGFLKENGKEHGYYTAVYQDYVSIEAYSTIVEQIKSKSVSLITKENHAKLINKGDAEIYRSSKSHTYASNISYYSNTLPMYIAMEEDLLLTVLNQSNLCSNDIQIELNRYRRRKNELEKTLENNTFIHFCPIDILKQISKQEIIIYGKQNLITNPPMKLTKEQFKQHLKSFGEFLLKHKNFQVCFTTDSFIPNMSNIHCWCKRNELLCFFDNNKPDKVILSDSAALTDTVANLLEQCYIYSPNNFKSKESVIEILKSLCN